MISFQEILVAAWACIHVRLLARVARSGRYSDAFAKYISHDASSDAPQARPRSTQRRSPEDDRAKLETAGACYVCKSVLALAVCVAQGLLGLSFRSALAVSFAAYALALNAMLPHPTTAARVYAVAAVALVLEWLALGAPL